MRGLFHATLDNPQSFQFGDRYTHVCMGRAHSSQTVQGATRNRLSPLSFPNLIRIFNIGGYPFRQEELFCHFFLGRAYSGDRNQRLLYGLSLCLRKPQSISGYDKIRNEAPVKFLRHLRNASAHANRFNFYPDRKKARFRDPGVLQWQGKTIDRSLQDQKAFPDFFCSGDFGYLFEDISRIM